MSFLFFIKIRKNIPQKQKTFKNPIDKRIVLWYNIYVVKSNTREWRNWQTRTFEGRVVHTVRVQVPFSAPKIEDIRSYVLYFFVNIYGT